MTFEEWISDKEFTQYIENGEYYALQKLCFEAGQKNCDYKEEAARVTAIMRNLNLFEQVEKLKCCANCKHAVQGDYDCTEDCCLCEAAYCVCGKTIDGKKTDWGEHCDNWEMKE